MVNVQNAMANAVQAVKNNPVKTAAVVTAGLLVGAGVYCRVDQMVGTAAQAAAEKATELAQQFVKSDAGQYLAKTTVGQWVDTNVMNWIPVEAPQTWAQYFGFAS